MMKRFHGIVVVSGIAAAWLWSCENKLEVTGTDCPSASQLQAGISMKCGGRVISGTLLREDLPLCSKTVHVDCVATAAFPVADMRVLLPENVRVNVEVGEVTGTLAPEIVGGDTPLCAEDGDTDCVTSGDLVAVSTVGLADKLAAGTVAGGVTGIGVLAPAGDCAGYAQVGCLATALYPACDQATLVACLSGP
jgi:hypothetical protein